MAEINLYQYATISLPGSDRVQIGSKSTPTTITLHASAPEMFYNSAYLAQNDVATLATFGSGEDLPAFKAAIFKANTSDMYVGWRGTNADADNSVIEIESGSLFILTSDSTTQYNATTSTRVDSATATDISAIYAGNRAATTGRIEVWVVY